VASSGVSARLGADADASPPALPDFEAATAQEILAWAAAEFFPGITVACSMQDAVVVDLAWRIEPRIEVFFLETGFHFPETLETAEQVRRRYALPLTPLVPMPGAAVYSKDGIEACCRDRKVLPMERHLAGKRAWVTGLRRAESPSRANARAVEWDAGRGLVKVNPIVAWSDDDVERYCREHDVVRNPLRERGYASIGCWPCTLPGKGREGRWASTGKLECGIHVSPGGRVPAASSLPPSTRVGDEDAR
jgi:phosphoadenosine phosphosulfate reductase